MFKKLVLTAGVAVGVMCLGAAPASAQWGHHSSHHGSYGHNSHHGSYSHHGHHDSHGAHSRYHSYRSGGYGHHVRRPVWHDTTHLDYHAPSIQRHGFHFHIVPGHYDVHRSGHYHR